MRTMCVPLFFTIARKRTIMVAGLSSSFFSVAEVIGRDIGSHRKSFASKWIRISRTGGGVKSKLSIDDEDGEGKGVGAGKSSSSGQLFRMRP